MFYQDMSQLIRLLKGAVERTRYNPDETAEYTRRMRHYFGPA